MLDYYYLATPPGQRLLMFLEETGLPYQRLPQAATLALAGQWLAARRAYGRHEMSTVVPDPMVDISLEGVLP